MPGEKRPGFSPSSPRNIAEIPGYVPELFPQIRGFEELGVRAEAQHPGHDLRTAGRLERENERTVRCALHALPLAPDAFAHVRGRGFRELYDRSEGGFLDDAESVGCAFTGLLRPEPVLCDLRLSETLQGQARGIVVALFQAAVPVFLKEPASHVNGAAV